MKKIAFCILLWAGLHSANSQNYYYVFLTDKNDVSFNPYEYFDAKAVERRLLQGVSLYDSSDFPVNQCYINQIADLSEEYVGESRWFNMVMIAATDENIDAIRRFLFVKNIVAVSEDLNMRIADYQDFEIDDFLDDVKEDMTNQLLNLQGDYFVKNNIDGKGVRIAVFDGGFPTVDTHEAFKHLRDNNQIVNTWNFPRKRADVYGWNAHGTMVLSCIAGVKRDGTMLGLATGAEFLLARTEVSAEPKKEEFWWLQAVEWADKNGADIINSSLGYGIDRYNYADLDGKTALVTRAANMAAAKGILVCNSAGNEGSNKQWLKIIAPADADSVLTVGGINAYLTNFSRINFSSYGPTADGRMKPNVVAFGTVTAAKPSENMYKTVQGTSFSSPLVAGFAACAWQTNRNLTAMELKSEIEKSASLYPYFDYAYGYGVPQAAYFTEKQQPEIEKNFKITSTNTEIIITPLVEKLDFLKMQYLFYNIQNEDGTLDYYTQINLYQYYIRQDSKNGINYDIVIKKDLTLNNKTLNVFLNGYFEAYKIENTTIRHKFILPSKEFCCINSVDVKNQKQSQWGYKAKHFMTIYAAYAMFAPLPSSYFKHHYNYAKTNRFDIGIRYKYNVCKWYAIGGNLEYGITNIHYKADDETFLDKTFFDEIFLDEEYGYELDYSLKSNKIVSHRFNLEFFQRFNLGVTSFGNFYFDLGIYGGITASSKGKILWNIDWYEIEEKYEIDPNWFGYLSVYGIKGGFGYGVKARLGYGCLALFAQYDNDVLLHRTISIGAEFSIPY
jgi:subtilisin family serine protease